MRFNKILLINPPKNEQGGYKPSPLALLYLGAYVRKHARNVQIQIIDGAIDGEKAVKEALIKYKPDLVGISSLTPGRHQALLVARLAKQIVPTCKTVLGGVHPTIMWEQLMSTYPEIDYIVRGEGEETLFELISGLKLSQIAGLVWHKGRKIIVNTDRQMIKNINKLPFPAWDMIDPYTYPAWGRGVSNGINLEKEIRYPIIFSRGCMGHCTFCSSWKIWHGYRYRSGKNVADEMELLVRKYNAKHFAFYDDTLTGNRAEIITFCKEIQKRKMKVAIHGTTRVDQVDLPMLKWMKRAGFYEIAYGIESGSSEMLLKINKRINLEQSSDAVKNTKKAGIRVSALMMFGLPGETKQDKLRTIKLLKKLKPDVIGTIGEIWIFPGTALNIQAKNAGILSDNFWLSKKPYYIYRGGIGADPIQWNMKLKDVITLNVWGTPLEKPIDYFFIKAQHALNKLYKIKPIK